MPGLLTRGFNRIENLLPMHWRGALSRLSTRLTLAMVLMVVATVLVVEFVSYRGVEREILPRTRARVDQHVRLLADELKSFVQSARADVSSFRASATLAEIIRASRNGATHAADGASEAVWRARMAKRFAAELAAKPSYLQFRIIGVADGGRELVRVDRSGPRHSIRIVPDQALQQKGDRYYVKDTFALRDGQIYVSPIDLNREHGVIEQPPVAVLRVATPIYDSHHTLFGALIINLDMRPVLAHIRAAAPAGERVYVVNDRGYYLVNPDKAHEFGFEYDKPYRIQNDYPQLTSLLKRAGVWNDAISNPDGMTYVAAGTHIDLGSGHGVSVVQVVPRSVVMAPVHAIASSASLAGVGVSAAAVLLAILIARSLTRPLRQTTAAVQSFGRNEPMRLPTNAAGEIGVLVQAFEQLVAEIKSRSAALAGYAQRETLYAAAVHSSNLAFLTTDRAGLITGWNPGAERLFGYSAEEAIGRDTEMLVPPERHDEIAMIREKMRTGQRIDNLSTVRLAKGGRPIHVVFDISPLRTPANELVGSSAIVRDVTEQRLAEELFELAVEACPSGMMMIDRSGHIVMANSEAEHLFGYRREELIGRSVEMLVPQDLRAGHAKLRTAYTKETQIRNLGKGRELLALHRDGSEFPVEIELNPIHIRDGLLILAVVVDISDRKRNERLKDEFVATVSHELRTPLTSITASLALLAAGGVGRLPEPAARLVGIAHNNGQRLVRLVNDILDIEKIESGKLTFHLDQVNARAVVEQALEGSRAYAEDLGVTLRLDPHSVAGSVLADPDRLAQVVSNLLSNAIKFSPRGEEVIVGIGERGEAVRITVRDHGPGIPEEFKPRVFEKFAQADSTDTRQKGGTGLGLSIVEQIVKRLGGEVGFESELGVGTLFFVELPGWRSEDAPGVAKTEDGREGKDKEIA